MKELTVPAAVPLQAFLFAELLSVFSLSGETLDSETRRWCLLFVALAIEVGSSYFILGWSANTVSFVSSRIKFWNKSSNSIARHLHLPSRVL